MSDFFLIKHVFLRINNILYFFFKYDWISSFNLKIHGKCNCLKSQVSTLSKFNIYVKLLSNDRCIYFNVLRKLKKIVYIYNFTCFG